MITKIKPNHAAAMELMLEGSIALSKATRQGICINEKYCRSRSKLLGLQADKKEREFFNSDMGKLWRRVFNTPNLNSNPQLSTVLYDKMKAPVKKTTDKGDPSTDKEALGILQKDIPELQTFLDCRAIKNIKTTYIDKFLKETVNGVMHPNFSLIIPVTYRSSSQDPNFQNFHKRDKKKKKIVRKAMRPRKGYRLFAFDFSGIEVAISCAYHKDPKMMHYVSFPEKNNMHTDMATQIFFLEEFSKAWDGEKILRDGTKNGFVFPQFYGDYFGNNAVVLANFAKLPDSGKFSKKDGVKLHSGLHIGEHLINNGIYRYDDFVDHIEEIEKDFWGRRFKKYGQWKKDNVKQFLETGVLPFLTGFTAGGLLAKNEINNYPIQGAAFHCLLKCLIKLTQEFEERGMKSRIIGQIHDECVMDVWPPETETVLALCKWVATEWLREEWKWINVPLEIEASVFDINAHWASDSETHVLRAA